MTEWKRKRFWSGVAVAESAEGWEIRLDGRVLRTPAKAILRVPRRAMAEAIAAEWAGQGDDVDPRSMPCTRYANSAIDRVAPQLREVVDHVAAYGGSDLLCYRTDSPATLAARQAEAWDPLLAWAAEVLGAPLRTTTGVVHVAQPDASVARLRAEVAAMNPFELAALHDLVALTGSLVIGLAAAAGQWDAETLWAASRIDETWQAEQWGRDEEAEDAAARKWSDFRHALRFWALTRTAD